MISYIDHQGTREPSTIRKGAAEIILHSGSEEDIIGIGSGVING